jgi:ureidoacrylate peracid hydrolase
MSLKPGAGPDIHTSALIVVDMQNDFLHADGAFGVMAKAHPERRIDMPFLASTVPNVKRLIEAFRKAGRPVVYLAHVLKADYSDAAFPYWRGTTMKKTSFLVEGSWGAQVLDELAPRPDENLVIKKGFGGFSNTPLDTVLRNYGVTTCVVCGVTTCVCVSTTVRGGVEYNYRMIVVRDAVAEVSREQHESELKTIQRVFGEVHTTEEVAKLLAEVRATAGATAATATVLG